MSCLLKLARYAGEEGAAVFQKTESHLGHAPTMSSVEVVADRFPHYEILNLIGQGGMGSVFRARQKSLDRMVAIKTIEENDRDPTFAERFSREARALARLSHPNIVTIHDFGQNGNFFFLVMEHVEGVNLRQAIDAKAFDPGDALRIIEQVCGALQYAHGRGVVHRDIKPENILLSEDGTVKIADFGLAKLVDEGRRQMTLTATRQIMGTVAYMAPEQIDNSTAVDHRADIYSLGVVFYELLTGHLPLGRFELPSERGAGVDGRIDPIVMKSLSRSPEARYQSASDLGKEVSQIQSSPAVPREARTLEPPLAVPPTKLPHDAAPLAAMYGKRLPSEESESISFGINEVHGGFAEGQGMLRFESHQLSFDWKVKDSLFGAIESGLRSLVLPVDALAKMELVDYFVLVRLKITGKTLESMATLPQKQLGTVTLAISRSDSVVAKRWIEKYRANGVLPLPEGYWHASMHESLATPAARPNELRRSRRGAPYVLMALFVLITAPLLMIAGLSVLWFSAWKRPEPNAPVPVPMIGEMPVESVEHQRPVVPPNADE
jgi:serine/threonine protein kinase